MSIRAKLMSFVIRRTIKKKFADFDDINDVRESGGFAAAKPPEEVQRIPVDAGGVKAEWVSWPGCADDTVLVYLHGGGYVLGGPDSHADLTWRLARACGTRVLCVDYRLAPEHVFPAAVDDATAAYRWLLDQDIPADRIAVAGDSAGGGLAASLVLNLKNLGLPLPKTLVLLSPWADLTGSGDSMQANEKKDAMLSPGAITKFASLYLGDANPSAPLASPIFGDLSGFPPTLVVVGDPEILLSDSERLVQRIKDAGGAARLDVWPGMPHVFPLLASIVPESRKAIVEIGEYVRGHLGTAEV